MRPLVGCTITFLYKCSCTFDSPHWLSNLRPVIIGIHSDIVLKNKEKVYVFQRLNMNLVNDLKPSRWDVIYLPLRIVSTCYK